MDGNTITMIGIVITLILGVFPLYNYYFKKYPGKISFIKDKHFDLYKTLITNISDLEIKYQGNQIDKNKYLLRGYLINNGYCDITKEMIEQNLTITFKNKSKWLSSKVLSKSNNLGVKFKCIQEKLEIEFGLLRRNEFVHFEALIDICVNLRLNTNKC